MKHCVLYARLSVAREESVSIVRQITACRKYAEARDWTIAGEFIDDGVSASVKRPELRPGWKKLLKESDFDAVVIWKVDRLARKVLDFLTAHETLQARGAGLVAVEDPIDMTTPQGRALATMLSVFGEMESEAIRSRVHAARAQLRVENRFAGGRIPYGYRATDRVGGGRTLEIDPDRALWVQRLIEHEITVPASTLAMWMTVNAPAPVSAAADHVWSAQAVRRILRNPVLDGCPTWAPKPIPELAIRTFSGPHER